MPLNSEMLNPHRTIILYNGLSFPENSRPGKKDEKVQLSVRNVKSYKLLQEL